MIFIPAFIILIDYVNPGFEDRIWPIAVLGIIIFLSSLLLGFTLLFLRVFKSHDINNFYLSVGLLNLSFGVSYLILLAIQQERLLFIIATFPLLTGLLIFTDIFIVNRRNNRGR